VSYLAAMARGHPVRSRGLYARYLAEANFAGGWRPGLDRLAHFQMRMVAAGFVLNDAPGLLTARTWPG